MRGCKHWRAPTLPQHRQVGIHSCWERRCLDCGAWLSLGPSNDGGEHREAIAIEVRAAEIAAKWRESAPGREWADFVLADGGAEHAGWIGHAFDSHKMPEQNGEWAGWLARQIANHDDTQGGET